VTNESITGDHRVDHALERLAEESRLDGGNEALSAIVASIPFAGSAISSILAGGAKRRVVERVEETFRAMKEKLDNVDETKVDEEYFKSDEFMTILLLAIEQLQTTHDKKKIQMIANALANSGIVDFSSDSRKELFMRTMRDLSPQHVSMLSYMRVNAIVFEHKNPTGETLTLLQSLAAHGLVEESFEKEQPLIPQRNFTNQREVKSALAKAIATPTHHRFRVGKFGSEFLKFFDSDDVEQKHGPTSAGS
jgi:hypothetical protein